MVSIRRKLGACVAAVAIAAVMVPTPIHAKSAKNTGTLEGFCATLAEAIVAVDALDDNLATDLALASLQATYDAYCR